MTKLYKPRAYKSFITDCPDVPSFINTQLSLTDHAPYHRVANFTCKVGFSLFLEDGSSADSFQLTCSKNATWVGVRGKCRKGDITFFLLIMLCSLLCRVSTYYNCLILLGNAFKLCVPLNFTSDITSCIKLTVFRQVCKQVN